MAKMKVLLSAYACRPNHGSEPAVGWNWTIEIAKLGHDVLVLTRNDNRSFIESESSSLTDNIRFIYYDLPKPIFKLKRFLGIYVYYTLWQLGAYFMIKKNIKEDFDIIHHLTYVSYRFPVFLHYLKGKFIFGPLAGGEEASSNLTAALPFSYQLKEKVRILINFLNRYNLFVNMAYAKADKIFVTTEETYSKIPIKYRSKTKISSAIGISKGKDIAYEKHREFTVLYAGQLLHWKGIYIALESYAKALKTNPLLKFKIIGSGEFKRYLDLLVSKLGLNEKVEFISKLPQQQLFEEYQKAHLFLFPSLHDSGGFVVIEAMSYCLPVICLDKGGPPYFVGKDSSNVVKVNDRTLDQITDTISSLIIDYSKNDQLLKEESSKAKQRSSQFEWSIVVAKVYSDIQ